MRRLPWAAGLLTLLVTVSAQAKAPPPLALDLEIALDAETRRLAATATVTLPPGRPGRLRLPAAFRVDGDAVRRDGDAVVVPGRENSERQVTFRYAGTLPALDDTAERTAAGVAGSYLPPGGGWYPAPADGSGFTYRLTVEVPAGRRAVASGRLVDERTTSEHYRATFESEAAGPSPVLLEGPYEIAERTVDGVRLRTYFPPGLGRLAATYLDNAAGYLRRFTGEIGAYPYSAFHVVAAPLPVGLGFANIAYMSERILPLPFARHRSLAHELLHNWWGGAVDVDYEQGNWAEGLTTYMADYALAGPPGSAARREMRLEWLRAYAALPAEREQALAGFDAKRHDAAQVVGYGKAAYVFHMLRRRLGDRRFTAMLRRFWQENRGHVAGWREVRAAAEAAGGGPLEGFFRQWVERRGAPTLRLADVAWANAGGGHVARFTLAQAAPAYHLRVPLRIETSDGIIETEAALSAPSMRVEIATRGRPLRVEIDPNRHVFRRLAPEEVPPILRDVTLAPRTALVLAGGGDRFREVALSLAARLADAGRPEPLAADAALPPGKAAVIVIGPPTAVADWGRRHGMPAPPEAVAGVGHGRAWAARLADGRPVLAVAAADAAALEALARPLPHYGRRGHVAFESGRAVAEGVASPTGGPLVRTFSRQAED